MQKQRLNVEVMSSEVSKLSYKRGKSRLQASEIRITRETLTESHF
jgi:hypothetical protein